MNWKKSGLEKPAAGRPKRIRPAGTKCMRGRPNPPLMAPISLPRPRLALVNSNFSANQGGQFSMTKGVNFH
uniref:Uncharacterized protein n=1 Tax=Desulfobacca acetoxidans TaxID=60893 RepID=A0A7V4LCA9_9BACT